MPKILRRRISSLLKNLVGLLDEQSPAAAMQMFRNERSRMSRLEDKVDQVVVQLSSTNTKVNILMSIAFTVASAFIYDLFSK